MMSEKSYIVLSPLKHDGERLDVGNSIMLTDKQALPLLAANVVEEVKEIEEVEISVPKTSLSSN